MPRSHEDLICWQLADELRRLIIEHTAEGTAAAKDFRFASNLRDAVASACRNQAEGFYKFRHKEMRPYFNSARGSLGETHDGITDGVERKYFNPEVPQRCASSAAAPQSPTCDSSNR